MKIVEGLCCIYMFLFAFPWTCMVAFVLEFPTYVFVDIETFWATRHLSCDFFIAFFKGLSIVWSFKGDLSNGPLLEVPIHSLSSSSTKKAKSSYSSYCILCNIFCVLPSLECLFSCLFSIPFYVLPSLECLLSCLFSIPCQFFCCCLC